MVHGFDAQKIKTLSKEKSHNAKKLQIESVRALWLQCRACVYRNPRIHVRVTALRKGASIPSKVRNDGPGQGG